MGFFESLATGLNSMQKANYKQATGKDYDRDYRNYLEEFEYKDSGSIRDEWEKLRDDTGIRHSAKKAAIRELMKEKGMAGDL